MMRSRKLLLVAGAILLVGVLFLAATVVAQEPEGLWNWVGNTATETGYFANGGTGQGLEARTAGTQGLYGFSSGSAGDGVYGYASGTNGWGLRGYSYYSFGAYGYSSQYIGVRGSGGSGSGDYGGYFSGFEGVRGVASGSNGYGTWGTSSGTYGIGAYGSATGTGGYGTYGYSSNYIGARGSGDEYGGYFSGDTGVFGYGLVAGQRGVYGYTTVSSGEGVRGYTGGYGGDGVTAYATNTWGFGVDAQATGTNGIGIRGLSTRSWAAYLNSSNYRGLYANGASGWYDAYFPDWIYAGGTIISSSGWSVVAQNVGTETLEAGDLVSFVAMDGRMSVEKANGANAGAIVGVVTAAYIMDAPVAVDGAPPEVTNEESIAVPMPQKDETPLALPEKQDALPEGVEAAPEEAAEAKVEAVPAEEMVPEFEMEPNFVAEVDNGYMADADVAPGGFMIVLVQGFTQVNVDASVEAGDWLVAAAGNGVRAVSERQLAWAERRSQVVIGRALDAAVDGKVWVYVNFR